MISVPSRPGSPESATLVVLQAYGDDPTSQGGSSQPAGNIQTYTSDDAGFVDSPSRSDYRLSAISSCSSTVNLVPPQQHDSRHPYPSGEFGESPFKWNFPSLPDLPADQPESASKKDSNDDKKPTMRMWEGWKSSALFIPQQLHDLSTRELAIRFGGAKTGLVNASMVINSVCSLTAPRAQYSLIAYTLVLILGMCFFAGGLRFSEQGLDQTATQIHSSLLTISVGALLLPAAYHFALSGGQESSSIQQREDILKMSHGVPYVFYLLFQFWSHRHLYKDVKQKSQRLSVKIPVNPRFISERRIFSGQFMRTSQSDSESLRAPNRQLSLHSPSETTLTTPSLSVPLNTEKTVDSQPTIRLVTKARGDYEADHPSGTSGLSLPRSLQRSIDESTITEDPYHTTPDPASNVETPLPGQGSNFSAYPYKEPKLSLTMTLLLLITVTILVTFNAEELVESMDGVSVSISKQWIGLVLLPAVSSIAECVTAMNVSVKDQLGLSVSVAVGSAIVCHSALLIFMIILGWAINKPLALLFDPFESVVSVQTMSHVMADGKSNWLDGAILISLYVVIAVSFWYYPGQPSEVALCTVGITGDFK
ncbi:hypothetical protein JVU11DRAFT_4310 [Chiua virens]|nr:hypothetical protein JVU11DRAFT_4310 [Chiua virens]